MGCSAVPRSGGRDGGVDGGLVNGATHIPFRQEGALIWLQFPYPDLTPSALPQGIDRLLPGAALSCDRVGHCVGVSAGRASVVR